MLRVSEMKFIKPELFPQDFSLVVSMTASGSCTYKYTFVCGRLNEITRIKHRFQRLSLKLRILAKKSHSTLGRRRQRRQQIIHKFLALN